MSDKNNSGLGEREAFEAWRRRTTKAHPDTAIARHGFGDDARYEHGATNLMWQAWQARAALLKAEGAKS